MKAYQLLFHGHAFPSVSSSKANGVVTLEASDRSKGRFWTADRPRGFWRSFVETNPASVPEVEAFFNRYGDPDDLMPRSGSSETTRWPRHIERLGRAAQAWDPPDQDGLSRLTSNKKRLEAARWFADPGERPAVYLAHNMARPGDVGPAIDEVYLARDLKTGDLVLRPFTLISYMTLSAVLMIQEATPMARCEHCTHWFGVTDARARFCSGACRNAAQRVKVAVTGLSIEPSVGTVTVVAEDKTGGE